MESIQLSQVTMSYQIFGAKQQPVLVLIQGLGLSQKAWPKSYIDGLVQQGFCVVTFDNRDAGQSYCHQPYAKPNLTRFAVKKRLGFTVKPPYSLTDMANDIIELLDKLALSEVHLVGVSMGGMIAQLMAIHYPHRVLSLTLMMTTSGDKMLPKSHPKLLKHMRTIARANSVAKQRQYYHKALSMISSPGFKEPVSKTTAQDGINVAGTLRQMMAILCAESRVEGLLRIQVPTLIIHGDSDALIPIKVVSIWLISLHTLSFGSFMAWDIIYRNYSL